MKLRLLTAGVALALLAMFVATPLTAAAAPPATNAVTVPVTGTGPLGAFAGAFEITRFAVQNGQLVALGTLTGTVTNTLGVVVGTINQAVAIPVTASGTCDILNLILGPLSLNLLGLQIDLNQVVLNITAQSGAGNLLGNLLCAVANLLNRGGPLTGLTGLLNNILRLLG